MISMYIAGPMTDKAGFNFEVFDRVAREIWLAAEDSGYGVRVISPVHISMQLGTGLDYLEYVREDLRALVDCDVIVLLDGWESSKGTCIERDLAINLNMRVVEYNKSSGIIRSDGKVSIANILGV